MKKNITTFLTSAAMIVTIRMLVAQAIAEGLTLVTHDRQVGSLRAYPYCGLNEGFDMPPTGNPEPIPPRTFTPKSAALTAGLHRIAWAG